MMQIKKFAMISSFCRQSVGRIVCQTRTVSPITFQRTMSSSRADEATSSSEPGLQVQHDAKQKKFFIRLDTGHEALLEYTTTVMGAVDLWHTEVPPAFRGKGVAKLLAQAALDYFSCRVTPMHLSCTYLQHYVKVFPNPCHQKYILSD
ncbi:protein NATD1-like [Babylonia areolata]|uniref:protein NATD1-like n=1 Tax=Babylonia areolata TaxID=304850 RepID=UPI003FD35039